MKKKVIAVVLSTALAAGAPGWADAARSGAGGANARMKAASSAAADLHRRKLFLPECMDCMRLDFGSDVFIDFNHNGCVRGVLC